jgi:hypothetical protein
VKATNFLRFQEHDPQFNRSNPVKSAPNLRKNPKPESEPLFEPLGFPKNFTLQPACAYRRSQIVAVKLKG